MIHTKWSSIIIYTYIHNYTQLIAQSYREGKKILCFIGQILEKLTRNIAQPAENYTVIKAG